MILPVGDGVQGALQEGMVEQSQRKFKEVVSKEIGREGKDSPSK